MPAGCEQLRRRGAERTERPEHGRPKPCQSAEVGRRAAPCRAETARDETHLRRDGAPLVSSADTNLHVVEEFASYCISTTISVSTALPTQVPTAFDIIAVRNAEVPHKC